MLNRKQKNGLGSLFFCFFLYLFLLFGCGKQDEFIEIGAVLPLTGSASENGEFQKQGIEVAASILNEEGGINGKEIRVNYGDSKNESKEGLSFFNKFSQVNNIPIVICTMSGISVPLASYVSGLEKHNTVLIATVASAPGIGEKSDWVFRSFIVSDVEAAKTADFAFQQTNLRKMAIFYVNDDYGLGGFGVFKSEFERLGGEVVFAEAFEKGGQDFRSLIAKMKAKKPQGVYVVGYDKSYALLIKQIGEAKVDAQLFSTVSLSVPSWLALAGKGAEGAYLTVSIYNTNPDDPETVKFINGFKKLYEREPNYVSAVTYSIVQMVANAIKKHGYTAEGIRQGLSETQNFDTIVGKVSFNTDGEAPMPVRVMRINDGKVVPLAGM